MEGKFYLGSLHKAKIISIDRRGGVRDFTAEGQDGLSSVLGLRVDAPRRILWVNSAATPSVKGFQPRDEGTSALHKYDLRTGRLIKRYVLDNSRGPHLLNDIAVNAEGDLFITDSLASLVYTLNGEGDALQEFVRLNPDTYPNGVTLSDDGARLYVANDEGVWVIDTASRKASRVTPAPGVTLYGMDGLYYHRGSLVGIQNSVGEPARVMRFRLGAGGDSVTGAEVLEANNPLFNIPTTGAVAGASLFYIANSQLRSFDPGGRVWPLDKLKDVSILKVGL